MPSLLDTHPHSRRAVLSRAWQTGGALVAIGLLTACGFELRKAPELAFSTMYTNIAEASVFGQLLKRNLKTINNLELITDTREIERAQVILELNQEAQEKVVLSKSSTGTVREYVLRYRVRFRLRTRDGFELIPDTELLQEREISFNETAALSKESEEQLLYRDMRSDLVQQLIRRLAAVRQL
jgi:LPS-assembly lipoprotein